MSESLHHIDQLFKDGAGDYTEAPAPANWDQLEQKLDKAAVADLRNKYRYWKRIAAAAILLLSLSAVALLLRQNGSKTAPVVKDIPQQKQEQPAVKNLSPENQQQSPDPAVAGANQPANGNNTNAASENNPAEKELPAIADHQQKSFEKSINAGSKNQAIKTLPTQLTDNKPAHNVTIPNKQQKDIAAALVAKDKKSGTPLLTLSKKESSNRKSKLLTAPKFVEATENKQIPANTVIDEDIALEASAAVQKADLLEQIRTAGLVTYNTPGALAAVSAPVATIRNAWKNPVHRFSVGAFYAPQKTSTEVAEGRIEHREDDHRQIGEAETLSKTFEAGVQLSYRMNSNWQFLTGISYSTQQSTIQPKTVYARHDERRGGGPGNPPPPGNGDLRYKLNCAAGYVFLDPKSNTAINFGDSLNTLRAENSISYINIPLQASYLFRKGKLEFGPVAGITTHILSKAKLNATLQESSGAKTPQTATINGLKKTYLSGMIGAQGIYSITDRLSVYVLPSTSFSLSPVNQNTPAKMYLRQLGVQTGIRLNL